jgi:hypothetical protein
MKPKAEMYDAAGNLITADVMPDGGSLKVKMTLMDGALDIAALTRAAMADADASVRYKPGTIVADGIQGELAAVERQVKRDLRLDKLTDAWRAPPAQQVAADSKAPPQIDLEAFHDKRNARLADAWKGVA